MGVFNNFISCCCHLIFSPLYYSKSHHLWMNAYIQSVQFSPSVMSDSLRPHESQHARPPCPSPASGVHPNPCPLSQWCHPTISSSVIPFSSCLHSFPASGSFQMTQLFASGGQRIGVSEQVSEQDPASPSVSLSHQEASINLLSLSVRGQWSSVTQSCPTLCNPMNHSTSSLPVHHPLPEFTQTHVHWVRDAIQPSHPLSSPSPRAIRVPSPSQHHILFQWVNSSHEVAKVLEFQL